MREEGRVPASLRKMLTYPEFLLYTRCASTPVGQVLGSQSFYRQVNGGTEEPHKVIVDKQQSQYVNAGTLTPEPRDMRGLTCVLQCVCGREEGGAATAPISVTRSLCSRRLLLRGCHVAQ